MTFAQDPLTKDSVTQFDEVILLDALKTKNATGIVPSEVIAAKIFQNYSPVELTSAMNQIPGVYVLSGAWNTNRITVRGIGARTLYGTDKLRLYYNDIPVTDGSGFSTIEAIRHYHGKDYLAMVPKYDGFTCVPSHIDYRQVYKGFYNTYSPLTAGPMEGKIDISLTVVRCREKGKHTLKKTSSRHQIT